MLQDGKSFSAELFQAGAESFNVVVVGAVATVAEGLGNFPAVFDVGFGDVEKDDSLDGVAGASGSIHNGGFFAVPAAD